MPIDPGGKLAEEIGVFVAVEVPQPRALPTHHRQRERVDMDRRAGVAARHSGAGITVLGEAFGMALPIKLLRLCERGRDVNVGGMGRTQLPSFAGAPRR